MSTPQHWLAIKIMHHGTRPVTHGEQINVKVYFDEDPGDKSDQTYGKGVGADQYTVASEYAYVMDKAKPVTVWWAISEKEYTAGSYEIFIWGEPYAIAAFSSDGVSDNLALGRLLLRTSHENYRGAAPGPVEPIPSVDPGKDLVIVHEVYLANSVVQFIVDEINTNSDASDIVNAGNAVRAAQDAYRKEAANPTPNAWWDITDTDLEDREDAWQDALNEARNVLGHRTHKNEGFAGFAQDIYFWGGGEWDHKPVIRQVWGALNRLGNRHEVYYYDGWSNIHFGYIGRKLGLPLKTILEGAGVAQEVDNSGEQDGDDPADAEAIRAGYNLGEHDDVTRQNIINILNNHPDWVGRK